MGVGGGMAEFGGDALFEALGDEVFEALGLFVELFDGVVEDFVEEGLDEAVMADDFEGAAAAGGREQDAAVAFVLDEGLGGGGELLEHVGDRGWSYAEVGGEGIAGDAAGMALAQSEDGLEVVVDGFGAAIQRAAFGHGFFQGGTTYELIV